jgi:transcriptional regulatory protein LevR
MKTTEQIIGYLEFSLEFYSKKLIEYKDTTDKQSVIEHIRSVISTYEHALKFSKED